MRNLKRALCLALASVMVLGMTVIGASAATASDFTDYDTVEEKEALDVMAAINVVEGDGSGNFNPDGHFTREEAAKILSVMLLGASNADKLNNNAQIFKDVAAGRWSAGYIAYCSNVGIIAGDGQGNFNPEGELDSVSFGKMLLVALGYDPAKEGYINNPGWQQSISGDMIAAGIDVDDVKFSDILTREQATVMAFNAIQTPLVEYANYLDPNKATYVTTTIAKEQTISDRVLSNTTVHQNPGQGQAGNVVSPGTYTIEFAEKYQQSLMRSGDDTEEFRRPAHKWTVGSTNIGRYTDTPDEVYTTKVTTGQIYNDLSLSETISVGNADNAESEYYIDGEKSFYNAADKTYVSNPSTTNSDTDDYSKDGVLKLKNKGNIELGGNGTLTEVYYSPVSYDSKTGDKNPASALIVSVNTYVGDVTAKVGETDKHVAYITVTPRDDTTPYANPNRKDPLPRPSTSGKYVSTFDTEDFSLEDIVLFTYSKRSEGDQTNGTDLGIQSVKVAEIVTGELTAYTENDRVAIDGESYSYSNKVAKEAHAVDKNYEVDVVLDDYGYAIDVDPVGQNTGYAVILKEALGNTSGTASGDWNDDPAVQLLLTNGTVVDKALVKEDNGKSYEYGDIISYKIDNRGKYTIDLAAKVNSNSLTKSEEPYSVRVNNGESKIADIVNKNNSGSNDERITASGSTIFLLKDLDGNGDAIYYAYYGIKNVPDISTRKVQNVTFGSNQTKDDAAVATVLMENSVASVVYIDASNPNTLINTSADDYVYVLYDASIDLTVDTDRGNYYKYDAIVNGEITSIDVNETTYNLMQQKSTLFTNIQVDDYDIYSLEDPKTTTLDDSGGVGNSIKKVANDVLSIGSPSGSQSYVTAENCEVFHIDEDDAISPNTVTSISDEDGVDVSYFFDTTGNLRCVIVDEAR